MGCSLWQVTATTGHPWQVSWSTSALAQMVPLSLYIIWLEQIVQTNLAAILGLFFPSYGKSVKGTSQAHGSSLLADSRFLEVSFTSGGYTSKFIVEKLNQMLQSTSGGTIQRAFQSYLIMLSFVTLRNKEYSERAKFTKENPISFLAKEPGIQGRNKNQMSQ